MNHTMYTTSHYGCLMVEYDQIIWPQLFFIMLKPFHIFNNEIPHIPLLLFFVRYKIVEMILFIGKLFVISDHEIQLVIYTEYCFISTYVVIWW